MYNCFVVFRYDLIEAEQVAKKLSSLDDKGKMEDEKRVEGKEEGKKGEEKNSKTEEKKEDKKDAEKKGKNVTFIVDTWLRSLWFWH